MTPASAFAEMPSSIHYRRRGEPPSAAPPRQNKNHQHSSDDGKPIRHSFHQSRRALGQRTTFFPSRMVGASGHGPLAPSRHL